MVSMEQYLQYHGLLLPPQAHSLESLRYAEKFPVEDSDVFAVTYPNSAMSSEDLYLRHHGLLLPRETHCAQSLRFAQEFKFRDDDVMVATYPKSGTTWMQEILPLVLNGADLTPIHTVPNWDRVPWLEEKRLALVVDQLTSPRGMVTHLPFHLMPPSFHASKAKVIYVMRNPKDVAVSSYHFHKMAQFLETPATFDEFLERFLQGKVMFGKWSDHVKSWRRSGLGGRILFITYEEMVQGWPVAVELCEDDRLLLYVNVPLFQDLGAAVGRVSEFLGCELSEEATQRIVEHCSFGTMKNNRMSNFSLVPKVYMDHDTSPFLRKGIVGDWKNHFGPEQLASFSSVIRKEMEGEMEGAALPWSLE
ncbi:Sulfotransferase family cytosolic 2B member 1 [Liparis tanakae]|uniref:Sulfotransferase n=1 Tax=Liparis tanakae TaxID=230148 RepID=A0A4Z2F6H0_9TELE|nr:Sulfotransferase family cytosolic 2B member 1 [Liparis tanakae]